MNTNPIHHINYEELAQAVHKKRESSPETSLGDKEALRAVLVERSPNIDTNKPSHSTTPSISVDEKAEPQNLPQYAQHVTPEIEDKIHALVATTLEKGLEAGFREAHKEEPFVIDLYHDSLSEKLLGQLKEKGFLS